MTLKHLLHVAYQLAHLHNSTNGANKIKVALIVTVFVIGGFSHRQIKDIAVKLFLITRFKG